MSQNSDYYSRSVMSDDSGVSVRGEVSDERKVMNRDVPSNYKVSAMPVSNGHKASNSLKVSDRHKPQSCVLLASVESLTETQSSGEEKSRRKSGERKIRFNQHDEFSD